MVSLQTAEPPSNVSKGRPCVGLFVGTNSTRHGDGAGLQGQSAYRLGLPGLVESRQGADWKESTATAIIARMNIELSALEERAEAQEHMAEALRILNAAIRRTHRAGLSVRVEVLTMYSREGTLPQLELGTLDRQHGAI